MKDNRANWKAKYRAFTKSGKKQVRKKVISLFCAMVITLSGVIVWPNEAAEAKSVPKITMQSTESGQYSGYHAVPDKTFMYKQAGVLHVVTVIGVKLTDYTLNKKLAVSSMQKITIPRYEVWGGFYHSENGMNYIAVGYNNHEEDPSKVVIRVVKFDAKWKRKGVAEIKGDASNQRVGIYAPFTYGNVSFAEYQRTLYLMTARTMFQTEDGIHSQSNIAFAIDTETMEAHDDNISYASHSFNQYARFQDGNLYVVDHGDAIPRGVKMTMYDAYGKTAEEAGASAHRGSKTAFSFQGDDGNNATGATIGGMEISGSNVLVAGSAQPHGSSINGVTGFASGYGQNLYLIKRNRVTGECSARWLTDYNPQTSGLTVDCPRLVKVSDELFAILYSVRTLATGERSCHCMYVDGSGQEIKDLTFDNIQFRGGTQPIVYEDQIVFIERPSNLPNAQIYSIPAN